MKKRLKPQLQKKMIVVPKVTQHLIQVKKKTKRKINGKKIYRVNRRNFYLSKMDKINIEQRIGCEMELDTPP